MFIKKISTLLCITITLLFATIYIYSMEKPKSDQNHIVFDMGLLVQPNHTRFIENLGWSGISQTLLSGSFNEQQSLQELFSIIKNIEFNFPEDTETVEWKNQQVPFSMLSWLKNKVTCKKMFEEAVDKVNKQYFFTSRMNCIVGMVFDPVACSTILSPYQPTFDLIKQLQDKGHTVHVLSNLHTDIRTHLVETYKDLFSQINGKIIVSGDIKEVKCKEHSKMYQYLLNSLPDFQNVFFIETSDSYKQQIESLITYHTLKTIIADPKDLSALTKKLQAEKLLPESRLQ